MLSSVVSLTPRQTRFVAEYAVSGNAADAARRAGYSANTARQIASENLSKPDIQAAIAVAKQQEAAKLELRKEHVIAGLLAAYRLATEQANPAVMVRAAIEIAKLCGFYDAEVVKAPMSMEADRLRQKFEAMNDEELLEVAAGRARIG